MTIQEYATLTTREAEARELERLCRIDDEITRLQTLKQKVLANLRRIRTEAR